MSETQAEQAASCRRLLQVGYLGSDGLTGDALATFAFILGVGAIGGIALGGSLLTSGGLWVALVASFALGRMVGQEETHA